MTTLGAGRSAHHMLHGSRAVSPDPSVVEIGAGHGLNFALYPLEVTEVVATEPEPTLRAEADVAARRAPVPIRVCPASPTRYRSPTAAPTPQSPASCSAPSRTSRARSPRSGACCDPAASCASTSASYRTANPSGRCCRPPIGAGSGRRWRADATSRGTRPARSCRRTSTPRNRALRLQRTSLSAVHPTHPRPRPARLVASSLDKRAGKCQLTVRGDLPKRRPDRTRRPDEA
jgi:hypothetical protein